MIQLGSRFVVDVFVHLELTLVTRGGSILRYPSLVQKYWTKETQVHVKKIAMEGLLFLTGLLALQSTALGNRHLLQEDEASGVASVTSHVRPPAEAGQTPADENPFDTIATIAVNGQNVRAEREAAARIPPPFPPPPPPPMDVPAPAGAPDAAKAATEAPPADDHDRALEDSAAAAINRFSGQPEEQAATTAPAPAPAKGPVKPPAKAAAKPPVPAAKEPAKPAPKPAAKAPVSAPSRRRVLLADSESSSRSSLS
eukprot:jgi/Botrbrau1/12788/Bobra.117_1s0007.1